MQHLSALISKAAALPNLGLGLNPGLMHTGSRTCEAPVGFSVPIGQTDGCCAWVYICRGASMACAEKARAVSRS